MAAKRKARLRVEMAVGWIDSPKVAELPLGALKTWLRMIDYCRIHGTDGHVPAGAANRCCGSVNRASTTLRRLVNEGLIEVAETGFYLPDYLEHNRPHSAIVAQSERRSKRGKKHRSQPDRTGQQGDVVSLSPSEREGDKGVPPTPEGAASAHGASTLYSEQDRINRLPHGGSA